jgi:hypothetical protein
LKVAIAVNRELILLYWDIGRQILERQDKEGWGTKIIDKLAADLKHEFCALKAFYPRNLKCMRKLAAIYTDIKIVQQAAAQILWVHIIRLMELVTDSKDPNMQESSIFTSQRWMIF